MASLSDDLVPLGRPPTEADVQAFLDAGQVSDAIQAYRLLHGVDLGTAKEAIAARRRFMPLTTKDRWAGAVLLALALGLLTYFGNEGHPWRAVGGILGGLLVAWKFFERMDRMGAQPRSSRPATAPDRGATDPSSADRGHDGAA